MATVPAASPSSASAPSGLLARIEAYYDAVPRTAARAEDWYPFTLFVNQGPGWAYYARPALGATVFRAADVRRVRQRQRVLGVPEAFEWVQEVSPKAAAAVEATGLSLALHPLLVLTPEARRRPPPPSAAAVHLVTPDDDLRLIQSVAHVAFGAPGTGAGDAGVAGVAALREAAAVRAPATDAFARERLRCGITRTAATYLDGVPVCVGSHQPIGDVTEIVGVGTLPAFRRRGLAAAVVDCLVEDALQRGARTVFLSAGDSDIARVYERLGFRRIGTACTAEPGE
jgi:ribosomal protein S18 acetylase RimI-like enzyme